MVGPARPQIVLFGSSIVQMSFSNDGWGATLADIYARKDAASQPSLIIAYFGGNDSMGPHSSGLGPHVPLPEYIENMRKIATHLQGLSDTTRIIFLTCPPVDEVRIHEPGSILSEFGLVRTNELCRIYSEACIELCNEMGIKVIDIWTALRKQDDWLTYFIKDGIHLSGAGSKIVVEEILKVLKEAEWKPSLHWKSMPTEFSEDSEYDVISIDGKTTLNPSDWTLHREIQWD
ncbi:GDSL esterase/lipase WDL1-like isoform X2 [Bidens hawaiensis]|uniref:GDSL esterase/lipase WDL1-like isoform X2 n=1 Tax=Bidens hawaiensis TaxID=980011 RepID=UPI00404A4AB1